ncbi:MAG: glycosyltransferase family 4 protein [Bacteroidetes bacterium]|nr:glycosyltransferase family 4 protein [Bacteroidota bacterium]
MTRKKNLWLCNWYPNKPEPFNGDFIQRHARAAALYNDIHVIHLAADTTGETKEKVVSIRTAGGLTEQIIYYRKQTSAWGRFRAHYRWLFLYRQALRNYVVINGKPSLVHVQVPVKAGIMAVWFKRRYKVPFVVTEHWGIYNDVVDDNYANRSRFFKRFTRQVFEEVSDFISVSKYLAEGVNRFVQKKTTG